MMMNSASASASATMASYYLNPTTRADNNSNSTTTEWSTFPSDDDLSSIIASTNIITNNLITSPLHEECDLSSPTNYPMEYTTETAAATTVSTVIPAGTEECGGDLKLVQPQMTAEEKAVAACISHKEAERRRRQRINGHISTLRSLLPNLHKNDKATLLGETVRQVRELKKRTSHLNIPPPSSTNSDTSTPHEEDQLHLHHLLPKDTDEVRIRCCQIEGGNTNSNTFVATLSCEDRADLLSDLTRVLKSAKSKVVKAEIGTVGGRVKVVLKLQHCGGGKEAMAAVSRALRVIVDRPVAVTVGTGGVVGKRQRHFH